MSVRGPLVAVLLACPAVAGAWEQAMTREEPHRPLHLADTNCVMYTVHEACSADVPYDACRAAVDTGMAVWSAVPCSYVTFVPLRPASCCRPGFQQHGPNVNCVMWREDEWPPEYPPTAIAITTLTYTLDDGAILDGDIEMNGADLEFATDCSPGRVDIWNTITHEAGHLLGLDHTDVPYCTMRPGSWAGDCNLRDLCEDDIEGVCTLYPAADDPDVCLEPIGGVNYDCTPPPEDCGCRAPGAGPVRGGLGVSAAVGLLAALLRRRRPRP